MRLSQNREELKEVKKVSIEQWININNSICEFERSTDVREKIPQLYNFCCKNNPLKPNNGRKVGHCRLFLKQQI